jgi:hypothetical protein
MAGIRLSPHFSLSEFTSSTVAKTRNIDNTPTPEHIANLRVTAAYLEWVRSLFGGAIIISSGYRSAELNRVIGGARNSDHTRGLAVDFRVSNADVWTAANKIADSPVVFDQLILERMGLGPGRGIIHMGFASKMRRQVLTQRLGPGTPIVQGLVRG